MDIRSKPTSLSAPEGAVLTQSDATFRGVFEHAGTGIALVGKDGQFLKVNQCLCDLLGYSSEELESKTFQEISFSDEPDPEVELFEQLRTFQIPDYLVEKRYLHREGRVVWIHLKATVQRKQDGEFLYCISIVRDITERKRILSTLDFERNRAALMSEVAGLGVFDWNLETGTVEYSKIWKAQLGYSENELSPDYTTFSSLLHPDDDDRISSALQKHLKDGENWNQSFRMRHKGGAYRWISAHGLIFRNDEGAAIRFVGGHLDLTEDRERTEAFRQAMENAKASDLAKSEFMANISHELRTPLNPIVAFSEMLKDEIDSDPEFVTESAEIIFNSSMHMLSLIDDILNFSHLQSGQVKHQLEDCLLRDLFFEVEVAFRNQAEVKGLRFEFDMNLPDERVSCIPKVIRQISFNLIGNAIKFTESGSVLVSGGVLNLPGGEQRLILQVRDTGIGIPKNKQKKIFEPFEQADNSTTRKFGGTGLGLAITVRQLDLIGGAIELESREKQGSCFTVTIPMGGSSRAVRNTGCESSTQPSQEESVLTKENRVMVVEDDPYNRVVIEKMLRALDFTPTVFASARAAIDDLSSGGSYDLILMDLKMSGIDGFEAAQRIRQTESAKSIPIVPFTADVTEQVQNRCKDAGMVGFLSKPLRMTQLVSTMNEVLQGSD